jgi:hypothetical protein
MPSGVRVHRLEVIRTQHEDDKRQWRVHLDLLSKSQQSVAPRQEWIFEDRSTAIKAIFQNAYLPLALQQRAFEHARPTLTEGQSLACRGDDSP